MIESKNLVMKSKQLLSVVFSLIMLTGITAGNAAFADSDELDDLLEGFCQMNSTEQSVILTDYNLGDYATDLESACLIEDEDEREDALEEIIDEITFETRDIEDDSETEDELDDDIHDLDDRLERFCEMNDEDKRQLFADHPRLKDFVDKLTKYCQMSEDEREDAIDTLIKEHFPGELERHHLREYSDKLPMNPEKEMRSMLDKYCEMSDEDKKIFVAEHDKAEDHVEKMNHYCVLTDETDRMDFIKEHRDEYIAHMKDQMMDKMSDHLDYDGFCALTDAELATKTFDADFVERASKWCEMTPDERDDYKEKHHDEMYDKVHDKIMDKVREKISDKSDHLKAMIMDKRDISDERRDEIRMKYIEKHGDLDEKKSELKMKFKEHMKEMRIKISDERKASIHDRLAEMKAFKAELRERASDMTDEEKQQLREDFIEKAKDMRLAWISPRTQITVGVDAAEVECREGHSLVMKASNGVPICLKADTALKMIDRGIVVPAN